MKSRTCRCLSREASRGAAAWPQERLLVDSAPMAQARSLLSNASRCRQSGGRITLGLLLLCLTTGSAQTEPDEKEKAKAPLLEGSVSLLIGFGGEALGTVVSTAGSYELNAGDGSGIAMGLAVLPYRSGKNAAGLALELGYMRGRVVADNGALDTRRIPLSLVAQYHRQSSRTIRWQFGLGAVYHHGAELNETVDSFRGSYSLDSSVGWRASAGFQWFSTPKYGIELELYHESVQQRLTDFDIELDASSTGMNAKFLVNLL